MKNSSFRTMTDGEQPGLRTRGQTPPRFAPPSSKRTSPNSVKAHPYHKRHAESRDITTAAEMDEEITNQKITDAPAGGGGWSKVFSDIIEVFRLARKDAENKIELGNLKPGERLEIVTAEIDGFAGKKTNESGPGRWSTSP
ncbi:hypothetical protein FANTH_7786 [Fusarium anthophilum]|uniref:Uncharacterized protein n=1 Tax=Fusarium anthophilum TaxID=48485 RepID=A0A8H4ZDY7_9HYPO|nr:hypothetical protein FANTH_7786 [Fusarium anthophilum]